MAETPQVLVGCADLPPRKTLEQYFADLGLLETSLAWKTIPALGTLRKWRAAAGDARFAVVAHESVTYRRGPATDAAAAIALDQSLAAARELDAAVVVFRTAPTLAPSGASRDQLRRFFGELATAERVGAERVWWPDGPWPAAVVASLAAEADVLAAFDPLATGPGDDAMAAIATQLARGRAYLRLDGLGRARDYGSAELETLVGLLEDLDQAYVVFGHPDRWRSARALVRALAG